MGNFWQKRYWYGAILLILSILLLLFCWNNWDILRFFTFSDPEVCALCQSQSYDVPCLLDASTGEVSPLVGTLVPGKFQFIGTLRASGGWSSDSRTGRVLVPADEPTLTAEPFCQDCRLLLLRELTGTFGILDLSAPSVPQLDPVEPGEYDVLGWNISVQKEETGLSLAVSPLS